MKYPTLSKTLTVSLFVVAALPVFAADAEEPAPNAEAATAAPAVVDATAQELFQRSLTHCEQASRSSRNDLALARDAFTTYQRLQTAAREADSAWFESDALVKRKHEYCAQVGENIARAEAIPLAEESLVKCSEARLDLERGAVTTAAQSYEDFLALKAAALAKSESVQRVGSLGVQFRVCERLEQKMAAVSRQRSAQTKLAEQIKGLLTTAAAACDDGQALDAGNANQVTVDALAASARVLKAQSERVTPLMERLNPVYVAVAELKAQQQTILQCTDQVAAQLARAQHQLVVRKATSEKPDAAVVPAAAVVATSAENAATNPNSVSQGDAEWNYSSRNEPAVVGGEVINLADSSKPE